MKEEKFKEIIPINEQLKIYKIGDSILRKTTKKVKNIDGKLVDTIKKMFYTMYENKGIGLASTQVGIDKSFFIIDLTLNQEPGKKIVAINPRIEEREGSETGEEGCLSIPEFSEQVKRNSKVLLKAMNIEGKEFELESDGLLARAIQHELDHLKGKLFIDHLSPIKKNIITRKLKKKRKREGW